MKVYKFKCKNCGSTKYEKPDENTYECFYCGNKEHVYLKDDKQELTKDEVVDTINEIIEERESQKEAELISPKPNPQRTRALIELLLCIFLGTFGVHRFFRGRVFTGLIFLFTYGLLGVGVLYDLIKCVIKLAKTTHGDDFYD